MLGAAPGEVVGAAVVVARGVVVIEAVVVGRGVVVIEAVVVGRGVVVIEAVVVGRGVVVGTTTARRKQGVSRGPSVQRAKTKRAQACSCLQSSFSQGRQQC